MGQTRGVQEHVLHTGGGGCPAVCAGRVDGVSNDANCVGHAVLKSAHTTRWLLSNADYDRVRGWVYVARVGVVQVGARVLKAGLGGGGSGHTQPVTLSLARWESGTEAI
jgi:hypothetical protein